MQNLSSAEQQRYLRHLQLPNVGLDGQQRLKQARVLCIGAGGLGSPLLIYLAAAGIGNLGIVDDDSIELSNLQRQILYTEQDVGHKKALIAKQRLEKFNSNISITAYPERLNRVNALTIIKNYDIVVDGSDNFTTRYILNDACFELKIPLLFASIFQFHGQCCLFDFIQSPCYRCLYPNPPQSTQLPNCTQAGVFGVLPGIMGTLQASEVIKWLLGLGVSLAGRLLQWDALSTSLQSFQLSRDPSCVLCHYHTPYSQLKSPYLEETTMTACANVKEITVKQFHQLRESNAQFFLLDVREPQEYAVSNLGGKLIPLKELSTKLDTLNPNDRIIIHCRSGGRSHQAALMLMQAGFTAVENLKGGMIAWANEIDSSMVVG